jgi:hypothetical protein
MFKIFRRDPLKKLERQHASKLEEALEAQRNGKIPRYAELTAEAEEIAAEIDRLQGLEA